MEIVFAPTFKGRLPEAVPELTNAPLTLMVAVELLAVGVTVILAVLFDTEAEYPVVVCIKAGVSVPLLITRFDKVASADVARVTITVYVLVVIPSCAVTLTKMVLAPTLKAMAPDGLPDATATPFTVNVAPASLALAVTTVEAIELPTLTV